MYIYIWTTHQDLSFDVLEAMVLKKNIFEKFSEDITKSDMCNFQVI